MGRAVEQSGAGFRPARHLEHARLTVRDRVEPDDEDVVRGIVSSTGFFAPHEIEVAAELVREHLARGPTSGYLFLFVELDGRTVGYACYGPIACTLHSFDLYWIVVRDDLRGRGLGRWLLAEVERRAAQAGARRLYIETSSRDLYAPTRHFYERCGYRPEACLEDFYAPGDAKIIYSRVLWPGLPATRPPVDDG